MDPEPAVPDDGCPSLGVDAVPLDRYDAVTTPEGELLVYDVESEDAWIQADTYCSRTDCA